MKCLGKNKKTMNKWIQTDPSQGQYGKKVGGNIYLFKDNKTAITVIDIEPLSYFYIKGLVESYGYDIRKIGGKNRLLISQAFLSLEDSSWLIAECEFEQNYSNL